MKVPAYEALAQAFAAEGVGTVFTLTGDANMHWAHALSSSNRIRLINTRHEHAACTAAISYARLSGQVGVASVTSGPGFTQTMTALATASRARVPLVIFAGESPMGAKFHNQRIDQAPFAIAAGARYIQGHSAKLLLDQVREAFHTAKRERVPVVLGVPHDVQQELVESAVTYRPSQESVPAPGAILPDATLISEAARRLAEAKRPIIIGGRGVMLSDCRREVEALAERCGALLSETLPAKGLFEGNPYNLGIAGGFCSDLAAELFSGCDLVLAIGASLSSHTLHGGKLAPKAYVIQIDLEPLGLRHGMISADMTITCDAKAGVDLLICKLAKPEGGQGPRKTEIAKRIVQESTDAMAFEIEPGTLDPREVVAAIDKVIPDDWTIVSGSGHSAFFTTLMRGRGPNRFFSLREFGAVGNGLSYALGAVASGANGKVLLLEGDGGLMMHIQELETIRRHGMKLVVGVMNDGGYGAEVQKFRTDGIDPGIVLFGRPDFAAIGRGFGLCGANIEALSDFARLMVEYNASSTAVVWDIPISDKVVSVYQRRQSKH